MDQLNSLLYKYRVSDPNDLIELRVKLDKKLAQFSSGDLELEKLALELSEAEKEVINTAQKLSQSRKGVFRLFETKVQDLIHNLLLFLSVFLKSVSYLDGFRCSCNIGAKQTYSPNIG